MVKTFFQKYFFHLSRKKCYCFKKIRKYMETISVLFNSWKDYRPPPVKSASEIFVLEKYLSTAGVFADDDKTCNITTF